MNQRLITVIHRGQVPVLMCIHLVLSACIAGTTTDCDDCADEEYSYWTDPRGLLGSWTGSLGEPVPREDPACSSLEETDALGILGLDEQGYFTFEVVQQPPRTPSKKR